MKIKNRLSTSAIFGLILLGSSLRAQRDSFPRPGPGIYPAGVSSQAQGQGVSSSATYCEISPGDLKQYPLDPDVERLIKKSCSASQKSNSTRAKPNRVAQILRSAFSGVSHPTRQNFITYLSESHVEAQKRLFNFITHLRAEHLKELIEKSASLKCEKSSQPQPYRECISIQFSNLIDSALTKAGNEHIQNAVRAVEKELSIHILERETNPNSIRHLEMGYPSKPMRLKAKTAATGLVAGLIPLDQKLSKAAAEDLESFSEGIQKGIKEGYFRTVPLERDGFVAILDSAGNQVWKSKSSLASQANAHLVQVIADAKTGLPIAGDLDLALITVDLSRSTDPQTKGSQKNTQLFNDPTSGIESELEKAVREKINAHYLAQIQTETLTQKKAVNTLVNHGPESRNPSRRPPVYPMVDSQGNVIISGPPEDPHQNFRRYLEQLKLENQEINLPDHWKKALITP